MSRKRQTGRTLICGAVAASIVAVMVTRTQAAGITVTFPTRLAAGPDYATDVLGDAWDMCNPEDVSPFPYEVAGFSSFSFLASPCRAGGTTQLLNGVADSSVAFLYRGIYDVINPGKNGRNFPVDTSRYRLLSYKLSSTLAGETPQLYWFHNSYQDPAGNILGRVNASKLTVNGTQITVTDLVQSPLQEGVAWNNGSVRGLRIDPNSNNVGQSVFFYWVRLTPVGGALQTITWSGGTGTATITVRDNSDGTTLTVASGLSGSSYNWDYGVLPPGNYTLTVAKTDGTSGSASFTVNHPPTIQVTDPSPTTGEDYATKVFGNPWDMSDPADIQIVSYDHITTPTFSNGIATATNTTDDPNVNLLNGANDSVPIDTTKYRYFTYKFQVDGSFDLGLGSVARVLWGSQPPEIASPTTSRGILVWPGMNTYTVDLATLSSAPDGGLETPYAEAWTSSVKRHLRFDPHEFAEARTFHIDDVKLTAMPVAAGFFTIKFAGNDADGDPTTVSLYYDTDTNPSNGKTLIATGIPVSAGQYGWSTIGVAPGVYYIYAEASDGLHVAGRYSSVPLQVVTPTGQTRRTGDFDGDGRSDITVFRPSNGTWYTLQSGSGYTTWNIFQWGLSGDIPVAGDYDGDQKTDMAVYRPSNGTWYLLKSSTSYTSWTIFQWGLSGDIPVPGDYDGDGRTDMAVYRPSNGNWYVLKSSTNNSSWTIFQWGLSGDIPVPGDYDGDGRTDMAVYRPSNGTWYLLRSSSGNTTWTIFQWGLNGDLPVQGDYDGDGRSDMAVYRPSNGTWYLLKSSTGNTSWTIYQWGVSGDIPTPGDYDGDGKTDMAVYRPSNGNWYLLKSSTNYTTWLIYQWGINGDQPVVQR